MKKRSKKSAFAQTTEDYASRSSIHGIGYVFDTSLGIVDRLFWLLVVVAFVGVVVALTWNFWSQWRNEQVRIKLGSLTAVFRWLLSSRTQLSSSPMCLSLHLLSVALVST